MAGMILGLCSFFSACDYQAMGGEMQNPGDDKIEIGFTIWDWTAPAQNPALFEEWIKSCQEAGINRIELSVPWNIVEPELGKIDLSWINERHAICRKYHLGMRLRINSYYAGATPKWYQGSFWLDDKGNAVPPGAIPSLTDERFWDYFAPLCGAIAREFKGEDVYYSPFFAIHAEMKFADWWTFDPSSLVLWQKVIKHPRPEWLRPVVQNDVELPLIPTVPALTDGKPDPSPSALAFIAFRENILRDSLKRFVNAIHQGDPKAKISSPLGESYRCESARMSNLDYWGLSRGTDQVVHSYDFFIHKGNTPLWHVSATVESFKGISGLPLSLEFDSPETITANGYTFEIQKSIVDILLHCRAGLNFSNYSYSQALPGSWPIIQYARDRIKAATPLSPDQGSPKDTLLLFFSKWANYCYREKSEWLHDTQFGYWKLLHDLGYKTRIICEDNLTENLDAYRGIIFAFSPLELMPAQDRVKIEKLKIPKILDFAITPDMKAEKSMTLHGKMGDIELMPSLPFDSLYDLSRLSGEYSFELTCNDKRFFASRNNEVIFGFPLGYYYLNGSNPESYKYVFQYSFSKLNMKGHKKNE